MIEHLSEDQVEDYCRQRLRPADLLSVADHLSECGACQGLVEHRMNGDAAFFAVRSEVLGEASVRWHATPEQTAAYVDGSLSGEDRQMVADHLTRCEMCSLALEDLRAFREQIAPSLEREYQPAQPSAANEPWWRGTVASLLAPFRRSPGLAFAGAVAVLVLLTGWLIWQMPRNGAPKEEIVVAPPAPSPPAPAAAPAPVPVIAQLNDGQGQLTLDRDGKLSGADDLPPAYQNMLKDALTTRRIERSSQLQGLSRPPSSLMSTDKQANEFAVIEPVAEVLMTDHPAFRWSPMAGTASYVVEVYDSKFNLVAASPPLTNQSWTPPHALPRGQVFAWQVKAIQDGQEFKAPRPPAPQARFRIIDQAAANELANARRAHPSSHLALGLLYAEAGLLKEAEEELRALQRANPGSEIARRLLAQILALRRRRE